MGVGDALPHFITFPLLVCALGEWHPLLDWAHSGAVLSWGVKPWTQLSST